MGWYEQRITITGVRSAHNSINDELDKARWRWLHSQIERLVEREELESLKLSVSPPEE